MIDYVWCGTTYFSGFDYIFFITAISWGVRINDCHEGSVQNDYIARFYTQSKIYFEETDLEGASGLIEGKGKVYYKDYPEIYESDVALQNTNTDREIIVDGGSGDAFDISADVVAHYKLNDDESNNVVENTAGNNGELKEYDGSTTSDENTENVTVTGQINEAFALPNNSSPYKYIDTLKSFESVYQSAFSAVVFVKPGESDYNSYSARLCGFKDYTGVGPSSTQEDEFSLSTLNGDIEVVYRSNQNVVYAGTGTAYFPNSAVSNFHMVAVTLDGSDIKIYAGECGVDTSLTELTLSGTRDGDMSGVTMGDLTANYNTYIGAMNNKGNVGLGTREFVIDNFILADRVLTTTELNGIFNSGDGTEREFAGSVDVNLFNLVYGNSVTRKADGSLEIINRGDHDVNIIPNGSETINDVAGTITISNKNEAKKLIPETETNWRSIEYGTGGSAGTWETESFTLDATDISNKYVTLANAPLNNDVAIVFPKGGTIQLLDIDYSISGTTLSWNGLGLETELEAGSILVCKYSY